MGKSIRKDNRETEKYNKDKKAKGRDRKRNQGEKADD